MTQKTKILEALPERFDLDHLKMIVKKDEDQNFKRLCLEYLPLKFSRRHGDPSRPCAGAARGRAGRAAAGRAQ